MALLGKGVGFATLRENYSGLKLKPLETETVTAHTCKRYAIVAGT